MEGVRFPYKNAPRIFIIAHKNLNIGLVLAFLYKDKYNTSGTWPEKTEYLNCILQIIFLPYDVSV